MVRAIQFDRFGGPEVLEYREVRRRRAGRRTGPRRAPRGRRELHRRLSPHGPLSAGAAERSRRRRLRASSSPTGAGVTHVKAGDRVAYNARRLARLLLRGAARRRALARQAAATRSTIAHGAAMMLKGLTAWYLLNRSYKVASRRFDSAVRRGRRRRPDRGAVGAAARCARDRHREHPGEARARARARLRARAARERRRSARACVSSRTVAACRSSTTRSAATRSFNRSTVCGRTVLLVSFGNASGPVAPFSLLELMRRGSSVRHATHARRLHPRARRSRGRRRASCSRSSRAA